RQRWPDPLGGRQVVEADDAETLRDVEAKLARRLVDTERLEVIAGEDRRRSVLPLKQRPTPLDPFLDLEAAVAAARRVDLDAGRVHGRAVAVEPGPAAEDVLRPGDDGDPLVAETEQVTRRRQAAIHVRRAH